jgi:hypothetical protein
MTIHNFTLSNDLRRGLCKQHGVIVTKGTWAEYYNGTKDSLIAANTLKDGQFPSDEGNNKVSLRIVTNESGEQEVIRGRVQLRRCHVIRVLKSGNKFEVSIPYTQDELERKSKVDEYEKALKEERRRLAGLCNNKDQARLRHIGFMQSVNEAFLGILESGIHGYHYDKSVIDEYRDHCHEMWELLKSANIDLNRDERKTLGIEIKSKKLTIDSGFSSFMGKVTDSSVNLEG